ncbi:hypothetical protein [Paenarthrobacter sp. Z7-10]|uniref:hypothetical protein n=1 Tax=Paenarthrobacter sp. Z7-10 TaxID=2787635 RepID=UPI0022A9103C|nr:hypothetical protein [Paenarthrobacter sp. Z7-10]
MDAILVVVLCLLLYAISARDSLAPPSLFDVLQLVLVAAALAVGAVMLTAMMSRIGEFGFSPNKVAALGLNLLLLVHLVRAAWLSVGFLRGRRPLTALECWSLSWLNPRASGERCLYGYRHRSWILKFEQSCAVVLHRRCLQGQRRSPGEP